MSGFFVSYEFKKKHDNARFFLPLILNTNDPKKAQKYFDAMKTGLGERYDILSVTNPTPIIRDINEDHICELLRRPWTGKLALLKTAVWTFVDFEPDFTVSFDKNLSIARMEQTDQYPNMHRVVAQLAGKHKLPVQVVYSELPAAIDEYLAVVIVNP